jgi:transcriptional regulator of acetoin/glycerol metabolism
MAKPPLVSTLPEPPSRTAAEAHLFTYVLSYDDLLRPGSTVFRLDGLETLTIGRASDERPIGLRAPSELRAPDRWMSGAHAELARVSEGHVVRDLGSRNGTWVNGVRIVEHRLVDQDLVEIGHSLFCYRRLAGAAAGAIDGQPRLGPTRTFCPEVALLLGDLARVAPSSESVLILAETGSGKEVAAEAIHQLSGRKGELRPVDCGAVPESLFEATFFGHRRGAFTGAADPRTGEIVQADGGTLFLDEVGNMSLPSQAKLLRVLEDGRVTPLGASGPVRVDVRWIAATNRDLFGEGGPFRQDLLRRLAGYVARIPPLRRRREDLGELCAHLLGQAGVQKAAITAAAARLLFSGAFPGNVRQLRSSLRSAALLAGDQPIDMANLPSVEAEAAEPAPATNRRTGPPGAPEIEAALAATEGNVVRAAQQLETHPRQLYRWIEKLSIPLDKYRQ